MFDLDLFDKTRFYLLTYKIKNEKLDCLEMESKDSGPNTVDHLNKKMKGPRYKNDQMLARMVVSKILKEEGDSAFRANHKFVSMCSKTIQPYIKTCVNEAAQLDYHYNYNIFKESQ